MKPLHEPDRPRLRFVDVLSSIPFFLIPYDSVGYLLTNSVSGISQTLPATALFSPLYLILRRAHVSTSHEGRRVLYLLFASVALMVVVTALNILFEQRFGTAVNTTLRITTAARQGLSMFLGLTTFLMFLDAATRIGLDKAMLWTFVGGVPSLAIALYQFSAGYFRVQGFSSEPALFADMLIFAFIPACLVYSRCRFMRLSGATLGGAALISAFSTTGFLKAAFGVATYFASRRLLWRGLVVLGALSAFVYFILLRFPDNYVFLVISYMYVVFSDTGNLVTGSFIDRFFGLAGPVTMLTTMHGWFGFGLGGDTIYFDRLFSVDTAEAIRAVKAELVSISSLQGKQLLYGGVAGYFLYVMAWRRAYNAAPKGHVSRLMLPTVFLASLFSLAPFFLPYVWLWLAVATAAAGNPGPVSKASPQC